MSKIKSRRYFGGSDNPITHQLDGDIWSFTDSSGNGGGDYFMTYEEIGREMNVTKERIRLIIAKALKKLQHPKRGSKLKPFLYEGKYSKD